MIPDELGNLPFAQTVGPSPFNLISKRYDCTSISWTNHLVLGVWPTLSGAKISAAFFDRFNHCEILETCNQR